MCALVFCNTHCNTLQHFFSATRTATLCSTLQHSATHYNMLQHAATLYRTILSVLRCLNVRASFLQHTLQHTAAHCNALQHAAICCDTLERTAKCCNTLQHYFVWAMIPECEKSLPATRTSTNCNTRYNTLHHSATHGNRLQHMQHMQHMQHTATHCSTLQHTATHCNTLQHTTAHCNTLQHTAAQCSTLQHAATHFFSMIPECGGLFCFIFYSQRTSVASCCRVLQCVAECCTVCTQCYRTLFSSILHFLVFFIFLYSSF